ncbi:MAG: hypothetical protein AAGC67_06885 [Myxococcota bacterium]
MSEKTRRRRLVDAITLCLLAPTACGGEIAPDAIAASVAHAGRFVLESGQPILADESTTVDCAPGTHFGVDYVVEVEGARFGGILPIEFRWIHPELAVPSARLWGTETSARLPKPELEWGETRLEGRALWRLEHPDERKSGRYEFVIRSIESGDVLLSQAFQVEGC